MRVSLLITAGSLALLFAGSLSVQAAGSTMYGAGHWLHQMDTDRNGTVSKEEYERFLVRTGRTGPTFERLDTNRNGKLERNELRPLIRRWARPSTDPPIASSAVPR
jgi:hypothetical protein